MAVISTHGGGGGNHHLLRSTKQNLARNYRKTNLIKNKKQGHGNEACVILIITVPLDFSHSSYVGRKMKEKIMVSIRIDLEMEN
jgi:hypothetical protein